MVVNAAREKIIMSRTATPLQPGDQGRADIRCKFELDRTVGLLLNDNGATANVGPVTAKRMRK